MTTTESPATRAGSGSVTTDAVTRRGLRLPALLVPDSSLMRYYVLQSLLFGPFFLFALLPLYFRFRSLRYALDQEGITMRWGVLFRREVSLTYARIQDIHLTSNVVERWLGLARIQVQTASGSAAAEMTIEGVPDVDGMRDFLYDRMRGVTDDSAGASAVPDDVGATRPFDADGPDGEIAIGAAELMELTAALRAVAAELRALRQQAETPADRATDG